MPVQTTYTKNIKKSLPGVIAWDFGTADLVSAVAEGVIPFGVAVIQGTKARTALAGGAAIIGFATRSILSQYAIINNSDVYGPTEMVSILRDGYIWVLNSGAAAVADGSQLYVDPTGKVVSSATVGAVAVPGSRVEVGGAVGALVLIRVKATGVA